MIGILGGMGTQAGLDFCSKLAKLNRGKADQKYPLFILYNKASIPDRKQHNKKYKKVLNSPIKMSFTGRKNTDNKYKKSLIEKYLKIVNKRDYYEK